ncbi:MAG: hypothetical protein KDK30_18375 [Leptospiraceae bacterium]|nr:hypothetical protein [Leptospiraceae bacterium]MCB1322948.1 hypothetical protein [Leptospiraceae bacterium]
MQTSEIDRWIKIFHSGRIGTKGWDKRQKQLLALIDDHRTEVERKLIQLGAVIGPEWARANDVRRINNKDLLRWGTEMRSAARVSGKELLDRLDKIESEVKRKLQN